MANKKHVVQITEINFSDRFRNFNKRWEINNQNVDFQKFRNRVIAIVDQTAGLFILNNHSLTVDYAILMGHRLEPTSSTGTDFVLIMQELKFSSNPTYEILTKPQDFLEFITSLQTLFWVLEKYNFLEIKNFALEIKNAISISPGLNIEIGIRGNTITLYPSKAKELDEKLINETLLWLVEKPKVAKHFEQALTIYQNKEEAKYRNLLDNLRFSLEELLKDILHNEKTLENQEKILLNWLNQHDINQNIIGMYLELLKKFTFYQNNSVKHSEKWTFIEIEFIIYLTGSFLNFILEIERNEK